MLLSDNTTISVAARSSALSKVQVEEVLEELAEKGITLHFYPEWIQVVGDRDLLSSLKDLEKTNFFTKEIDECILAGRCRIAIHSAKDLPDPLPKGLFIAAITRGKDCSDVLVMKEGDSIGSLPKGAKIATSSQRREEMILKLRDDFVAIDIRGTIHRRLELLHEGYCDALVMAEAALIRLGLVHLNRVRLEGPVAKDQGRLAVVMREDDNEMRDLFACIDTR